MSMHGRVGAFAIALVLLGCAGAPAPVMTVPAPETGAVLAGEISAWLDDLGRSLPAGGERDRARLARVYRARDYRPIWLGQNQPGARLLRVLDRSAQEGIDPRDLAVDRLRAVETGHRPPDAAAELLFSESFLSYAAMMAGGRVDPAAIESDWTLPRPTSDTAVALTRVAQGQDPEMVLGGLAPTSADYVELRAALKVYRGMRLAGPWPTLPADARLALGDRGPSVDLLRVRLTAEGYLPTPDGAGEAFDAALDQALRRFQARQGLTVDGKLGPVTAASLNVGVDERIRQIELNLERLRAMAHDWPQTRIVVNAAAQSLAFYRDGELILESPVIVGDPQHPTPVIAAQVGAVIFNPAWNVPESILRKEIQPKLQRDPGYLLRNHMRIVGRTNGDPYGSDLDWRSTNILARGWELQQEPGPWNSLGVVALEMPNPFDVYLHDTPAKAAFTQAYRALSHGCIRVQAIRELAAALLGGSWSADSIEPVVADGHTLRVPVAEPVPVYLVYLTAFVDADGSVEFRDDVYGRDARLAAALARLHAPQESSSADGGARGKGCPTS
jgi:murein L,D-transpeptidase YcbB/YkuD